MSSGWRFAIAITAVLTPSRVPGQLPIQPSDRVFWIGSAVTFAAAALSDASVYQFSTDHRSHALDRWAEIGDGLGAGKHLVAAMAASWVVARLTGHHRVATHVIHVAGAYTVGNVLVSVLKPGVGRHRPDEPGDAWRFKPVSAQGEWHSFPSAHAIHAFTIAAAAATETKSRWIVVAGFSAATLVAWSRVYRLEHWPSDAVGAAVLGIVSAQTTLAWTHR